MAFINKVRKMFPVKKVNIDELERQPKAVNTINPNTIIYKSESDHAHEQECFNGEYKIVECEILPEEIICPDCGELTLQGLDYCNNCGHEMIL